MYKKLICITLFAIAMGFLESAIVIYLREIYYPEGFDFPLRTMKDHLIVTELVREAATIIMLAGIAWLTGTNRHTRFAWFIYTFAIWDLFYYVFLKVILNWPASWFTWDVLFLIPCIWVSPVLAPVILSLLMIIIAGIILYFETSGQLIIRQREYTMLIAASVILIANFCWDNLSYMMNAPSGSNLEVINLNYTPQSFNWWVFTFGCAMICWAVFNMWNQNRRANG